MFFHIVQGLRQKGNLEFQSNLCLKKACFKLNGLKRAVGANVPTFLFLIPIFELLT